MSKFILFVFLILTFPFATDAQTQILREANLKFDLPNSKWFLHAKENPKPNVLLYTFKRKEIIDSSGLRVIPNIAIIIESVPDSFDVIRYALYYQSRSQSTINRVLTYNSGFLKIRNAVGYELNYYDKRGLPHTVYKIYALNNSKGIMIIFDITSSLWARHKEEFSAAIRTLIATP